LEGHESLARALLRSTYQDLCRGARGPYRSTYLSARRFLDTPLFEVCCRLAGTRPQVLRREMLRRAAAHREREQQAARKAR
jgi:hypothetical protein